ncbi:MAG: hypothetical protein NTZ35_01230, partial [Ignavibacteriales bacterium]|nr:hypothetical protein [Ignavibacteriales bacterium]
MGKPIIEEYNPAYYIFPKNTQFTFGLDKYLDHDFIHAEEHSNRKMEEILKTDYFKYFDEAFYDDDYLKIMNEQIQRHGIFAWIYLDKIIHPVFLRKASNVSLDAAKFSSLYKQAFPNRVPIHAKSMEECLGTIEGEIRSKTILLSRKIKKNVSSLRKWFEENKNIVRCEICSEQYRMIDLPYWIYYGSNALKGCCYRCRIMESPSKDELQRL